MPRTASSAKPKSSVLMVRLDPDSKDCLTRAAQLRHISVSDYVRVFLVPQASKELRAAEENIIQLSPEEQLAFWNALHDPPKKLTPAQRRLGKIMRGEE